MVADEVCCMPIATTSTIALSISKTFLPCHLFNKDGKHPVKFLEGEKLDQTLLKFTPLCSLNVCNLIISLKHHFGDLGFVDCILQLKALFGYDYIQDNCFHGQHVGQKVYLFKMFVDGTAFGFDLV
jgi:hypothetical protein